MFSIGLGMKLRPGCYDTYKQAHDEAWQVLNANRDILDRLAGELLEKETLDHEQLAALFTDVKKLDERPLWLSSERRPLSDQLPIAVPSKAPVEGRLVDSGVVSEPKSSAPKRAPRPRKSPGVATA